MNMSHKERSSPDDNKQIPVAPFTNMVEVMDK